MKCKAIPQKAPQKQPIHPINLRASALKHITKTSPMFDFDGANIGLVFLFLTLRLSDFA